MVKFVKDPLTRAMLYPPMTSSPSCGWLSNREPKKRPRKREGAVLESMIRCRTDDCGPNAMADHTSNGNAGKVKLPNCA